MTLDLFTTSWHIPAHEQSSDSTNTNTRKMPTISFQVQDRTSEFQSCVASLVKIQNQRGGGNKYAPSSSHSKPPAGSSTTPRSEFGIKAKKIADEIAVATESLRRLAKLAARKTLFDDRPVEIAELTHVVKQRVARCNQAIKQLQAHVKADSKSSGSSARDKHSQEHAANVVVLLQGRLTDVTTKFEQVLELRLRNMNSNKARTEQFISTSAPPTPQPPEVDNFGNNSSANNGKQYQPPGGAMASGIDRDSPLYSVSRARTGVPSSASAAASDNAANPYAPHHADDDYLTLPPDHYSHQQQQLLLEEQNATSAYAHQRGQAVSAIESTIQELGGIFAQLATMVAEQRDVIQRIDADTEDISFHVQGAQRELLKYYRRVTSNRMFMVKVFGILILFFFIWVVVS